MLLFSDAPPHPSTARARKGKERSGGHPKQLGLRMGPYLGLEPPSPPSSSGRKRTRTGARTGTPAHPCTISLSLMNFALKVLTPYSPQICGTLAYQGPSAYEL